MSCQTPIQSFVTSLQDREDPNSELQDGATGGVAGWLLARAITNQNNSHRHPTTACNQPPRQPTTAPQPTRATESDGTAGPAISSKPALLDLSQDLVQEERVMLIRL